MSKPYITRRPDGEYSTVQIGDMIETCWFGNDGTSRVIDRTHVSLANVAGLHIAYEEGKL